MTETYRDRYVGVNFGRSVGAGRPGVVPAAIAGDGGADFAGVEVTVDGSPVHLTRREFQILRCLVEHRNRVLSRDRLLDRIWGSGEAVDARTVDVHLGRLRAKLGPTGSQIETVFGLGYRFAENL